MRQAGEVTYADTHKGRRNEGVIEFRLYSDMKRALEKLDGTEVNGRKIRLIEDRPGARRSRRSYSRSRSRSRWDARRHRRRFTCWRVDAEVRCSRLSLLLSSGPGPGAAGPARATAAVRAAAAAAHTPGEQTPGKHTEVKPAHLWLDDYICGLLVSLRHFDLSHEFKVFHRNDIFLKNFDLSKFKTNISPVFFSKNLIFSSKFNTLIQFFFCKIDDFEKC